MFVVFSPQLSIEQAQAVAEQVEMKAKVVQSEVKVVTTRHKKALEERECELLWKVCALTFVVCTAFQSEKNTQTAAQPDSAIQGKLQVSLSGAAGGVFAGAVLDPQSSTAAHAGWALPLLAQQLPREEIPSTQCLQNSLNVLLYSLYDIMGFPIHTS